MRTRRRKQARTPRAPALAWPAGRRPAHAAVRTCAGCGQHAARAELRRVARTASGQELEWRDAGGRGTYLHRSAECERLFVESRRALVGLRFRPDPVVRQALLDARAQRERARGKQYAEADS